MIQRKPLASEEASYNKEASYNNDGLAKKK
jgi:hypothetical protein